MPANYWFWAIYVLALIFGFWGHYDGQPLWYRRASGWFVTMILIGLIGYHVFGHPVQ